MSTTAEPKVYRPDLEPPPPRIAALPVARGYPVPWFVAWVGGEPEFRMTEPGKLRRAVRDGLCWVCGEPLGRMLTFTIGPMCAVNRISAEPPSHLECARYSARNCPFLSKPHMVRREDERTAAGVCPAGEMIRRNPGVILLWTTRSYRLVPDGRGVLFALGDPESTEWFREGRAATRPEVLASVESGLPELRRMAEAQGEVALAELGRMVREAERLWPKE